MHGSAAACGSARIPMGVLATVTVVVSLVLVPVAGQAQPATTDTWTPPRTPWGDPDLQGIWDFRTLTPFSRPRAGKEFFTEEEAAALAQGAEQNRVIAFSVAFEPAGTQLTADRRTSLIVDPPDGTLPPRTPEAQERFAADRAPFGRPPHGPEDRNPVERCLVGETTGAPLIPAGFLYNHNVQLFQIPGYVVLLIEMNHDAHIVPLDGRPHLGQDIRLWLGDSRGRWEDSTLVVDTTNFNDRGWGHLVERFTRVDADTITYEFTVDNPTVFTRSWSVAFPMNRTEGPVFGMRVTKGITAWRACSEERALKRRGQPSKSMAWTLSPRARRCGWRRRRPPKTAPMWSEWSSSSTAPWLASTARRPTRSRGRREAPGATS